MITKLSISLPKSLEEYARWRVRNGGYGSVSEYFRELVRVDQRFQIEKLEQREAVQRKPEVLASAARRDRFGSRY
jgi:putative addiction module CopG family antidote